MIIPHICGNQERYIHAERFTDETYPIPIAYRLRGRLDHDRLAQSVDQVIARHRTLQTEFVPSQDGIAAVIADTLPRLQIKDMPPDTSDEVLYDLIQQEIFQKPTKLTATQMVRLILYRLGPDDALLLLSVHHAISDGVSMGQLADEIAATYNGTPLGDSPDYYDVTASLSPSDTSEAYWLKLLADVPVPEKLPEDINLTRETADPHSLVFDVDHAALTKLAQNWQVTPFSAVAALSQAVFAHITGTDQNAVSFQSAGRKGIAGSDNVVGSFSNSLVLVANLPAETKLETLAKGQAALIRQALIHEDYPYSQVVTETGIQPNFGLNWFPPAPPLELEGLEPAHRQLVDTRTNYDVDFRFAQDETGLKLIVYYRSHLYSRGRVEQIAALFTKALAAASQTPDLAIEALFDPVQPITVPPAAKSTGKRLFDDFLERARQHPDKIALRGETQSLTYKELEHHSAQLARRLVAQGLGPGSRVGILAERGFQLVWTQIAVLRIGATMVPLDSSYPDERLGILVTVAQIDALITPGVQPRPDWLGDQPALLAAQDPAASVPSEQDVPDAQIAQGDPDQPAYILFTSGSTGTPKGVATSHVPALHFLDWQRNTFGLTAEDLFTNLNGVAHDMMIRDVFQPLSIGGTLAIPDQDDIYRPGRLIEWVMAMQPTAMHLTPAMGSLLVMAQQPGQTLPLRVMFFGGDKLTPKLTADLVDLAPDAQIVNFYGATETPQAATFHQVDATAPWRTHPIGQGIDGVSARIVDDNHAPTPPGVSGEIAIISAYPSLGYVEDGNIRPHERPGVYFTGDSGFELPGGDIILTGRQDDQVSIRGYRIELGEVIHALKETGDVQDAAVLLDESGPNPILAAFVVPKSNETLDPDHLYAQVARSLPHYMVPKDITVLEKLPLLPSGKLDRKTLMAMPRQQTQAADIETPQTDTERELCAIWAKALGVERVGRNQSFAGLRGDSLNYVEICLASESLVGDMPENWESLSIQDIAALKTEHGQNKLIKWIETPLFVRAVAITLVVSLHLKFFSLGGGSTTALFMVSGFLIARLQLHNTFTTGSLESFWQLILKIMIPSALYVCAIGAMKLALGRPAAIESILFLEDFVDMRDRQRMTDEGHLIPIWYISCFFHMLLMTIAFAGLWLAAFGKRFRMETFVLAMTLLGLVLRFGLPALLSDEYLQIGFPPMSMISHLPTTHFGIFALGMGMGLAQTTQQRLLYTAMLIVYSAATAVVTSSTAPYVLVFVGLLMLFTVKLPIPRILHRSVFMISGASLFIYLTHEQFAKIGTALRIPEGSMLLVGFSILCAVFLWIAWLRFLTFIKSASGTFSQGRLKTENADHGV